MTAGGEFRDEVLAFCRRFSLGHAEFGRLSGSSSKFISVLIAGRKCQPKTIERLRAFMAQGDPRPPEMRLDLKNKTRGQRAAAKYTATVAFNAAAQRQAEIFRRTDDVERAKTFIRSRTPFCCFEAQITKPELLGYFFIGSRLVDRDGLLEYARKRGWEG